MPGWLSKIFSPRTAVEAGRKNPALQSAISNASLRYERIPADLQPDDRARRRLARKLYLELHEVFNAASPHAACRQKLAAGMLDFARLQVLMIPPAPQPDASGLRGLPGISGGLGEHLDRIARDSDALSSALHAIAGPEDADDIRRELRRAHALCHWFLESFDGARRGLGDTVDGRDWYRPFMFAACATQEHNYRRDIGLPPAFEENLTATAPIAYSIFTDIVVSGASDPVREWLDYHAGSLIPLPAFEDQPQGGCSDRV
ncbi:MAG: hypothetical protein ACREQZ_04820 [Woeseiaceae bacterium]